MKLLIGGRWGRRLTPVLLVALFCLLRAPQALAFPYVQQIGNSVVYAEQPIPPGIRTVMARADALLRQSPINVPGIKRQVVLTDGGWRWTVLALNSRGSVALRRPFSNVLIMNHSDVARDRVTNGAAIGGTRTLSGTIAHETIHMLVSLHLGEFHAMRLPTWKQEGYADFVGGETSINTRDEGRIRASDRNAKVLVYYEGHRRVTEALRRNGGSVDALFAP